LTSALPRSQITGGHSGTDSHEPEYHPKTAARNPCFLERGAASSLSLSDNLPQKAFSLPPQDINTCLDLKLPPQNLWTGGDIVSSGWIRVLAETIKPRLKEDSTAKNSTQQGKTVQVVCLRLRVSYAD
jgi:hypothetical protein